jgi:hypothetical protein
MSSSDSDDSYNDDCNDYHDDHDDDYSYVEEPCPLEFLPFRNIINAAEDYMDTQPEYPLYDDTMIEFLAIAEASTGGMAYERELKFHKFLLLPTELRLKVYGHYLEDARHDRRHGTLEKHLHFDNFRKPCCVWYWPEALIICDRVTEKELPTAKYAPWLPALAFTNKQLLGEVTICMLQTTKWFDCKYNETKPIKIAR